MVKNSYHAWAIGNIIKKGIVQSHRHINDLLLFCIIGDAQREKYRGCSSVGRATVLHAVGQRFESAHLHQIIDLLFVFSCVE